jgi:hypothetical protein
MCEPVRLRPGEARAKNRHPTYGEESAKFMKAIVGLISHAVQDAVFPNQVDYIRAHQELKAGTFLSFFGPQGQPTFLMDHQDVRVLRLQAAQIEGREGAASGEQGGSSNLAARKFVDALGQAKLIEDLEHRGVNRIAPEFAVEIVMHLKKCGGHTSPREQQAQSSLRQVRLQQSSSLLLPRAFGLIHVQQARRGEISLCCVLRRFDPSFRTNAQ